MYFMYLCKEPSTLLIWIPNTPICVDIWSYLMCRFEVAFTTPSPTILTTATIAVTITTTTTVTNTTHPHTPSAPFPTPFPALRSPQFSAFSPVLVVYSFFSHLFSTFPSFCFLLLFSPSSVSLYFTSSSISSIFLNQVSFTLVPPSPPTFFSPSILSYFPSSSLSFLTFYGFSPLCLLVFLFRLPHYSYPFIFYVLLLYFFSIHLPQHIFYFYVSSFSLPSFHFPLYLTLVLLHPLIRTLPLTIPVSLLSMPLPSTLHLLFLPYMPY